MDSNKIKILLDKYWACETSLQEEAQLRSFFEREDVPADLEAFKPMFGFFRQEQNAILNSDFDERLSSKLKTTEPQQPRAKSLTFYLMRAAAVAAIFAGALFFTNKFVLVEPSAKVAQQELSLEEKTEARLVYAEAKAALMLLSSKINEGTDKAESGIVKVRKATKVIKN